MARLLVTDEKDVEYARKLLARAKSKEDIRMAQAVLLPHDQKMTFAQTADMIGVSKRSVSRYRQNLQLKREGKYAGDTRGGRRRENMPVQEEKRFLEQWKGRAASGQIVVACEIWQALEQQLGRRVSETYVYRLLARNAWRKLAPDTRHPKADVPRQQEWKKNSRKIWMPCSSRSRPKAGRCA